MQLESSKECTLSAPMYVKFEMLTLGRRQNTAYSIANVYTRKMVHSPPHEPHQKQSSRTATYPQRL
jgi:hypothetical protein